MSANLLEVKNLVTEFSTPAGKVRAVDGISFHVKHKETVGIVGESGCGKSVTALSIMGLVLDPGEVRGSIEFNGQDLVKLSDRQMRKIRGNDISMIFQEPMTSLNPVYTIGNQLSEPLRLHQGLSRKQAWEKSIEYLKLVGISSPEKRVHEYPHQLSGGMQQRAMIAMALTCNPKLLIADEPTTALDVTIQAQILELMKDLKEKMSTSIMMITHDLAVVVEMCERVIVMYAGRIVETGTVRDIFKKPHHPYTEGLIRSIPKLTEKEDVLYEIKGSVPSPLDAPPGCKFNNRCEFATERCEKEEPELITISEGHEARCFYPRNVKGESSYG
ncbi:oligopeptide/dipeptide ABC transporter, ATPase subunit [Alkaliphilus metalliredigens QYMF]|uniref:Oligopeptide/dipeptide ABC transporter, ATPase subunit n=1 Tax=Alkaliphilus metalliredigens (strain QYMF) TaxID=293826 RepID=A6TPV7_ALKMQ|nr:ABC transporter ATP-binding protein [Alkaliphilus metalliredigens]ABR48225.1 oligopeptide/dipeptide ABC transporter, ATPase subunit [Alkaliphilus metalliredigens QYMF]